MKNTIINKTTARARGLLAGGAVAALLVGGVFAAAPAMADNTPHTLPAGWTLKPNTSIRSIGDEYYLLMQTDGNLVEFLDGHPIWQSKTSGNPGATLHMQTDGNAVVYSTTARALWQSGTARAGDTQGEIGLGTDGNLWVKDSHEKVVWQNGAPATNALVQTGVASYFPAGYYLHNRTAKLVMQTDGNLVSYVGAKAVWSSKTAGNANAFTELQQDGDLVVSSEAPFRDLWTSRTGGTGPGHRLSLGTDGRLTLYSGTTILWQS